MLENPRSISAEDIADLRFFELEIAFVGGGLLVSVFREELPDAKRSKLSWFSLGLLAMTALLLAATATHRHG